MRRAFVFALSAAALLAGCGDRQPQVIVDPPPPSASAGEGDVVPPAPQPGAAAVVNASAAPAAPGPASPPAAAAKGDAAQGPRRKAGLWRLTASNGEQSNTATLCVTDASEARLNAFDTRMLLAPQARPGGGGPRPGGGEGAGPRPGGFGAGAPCAPRISKQGAGWKGAATCTRQIGDGEMQISLDETLTGDLSSRYSLKSSRTISGAPAPQMNRTTTLTVEGTWKGPCPAGQSGGDLTTGGRTINLAQRG